MSVAFGATVKIVLIAKWVNLISIVWQWRRLQINRLICSLARMLPFWQRKPQGCNSIPIENVWNGYDVFVQAEGSISDHKYKLMTGILGRFEQVNRRSWKFPKQEKFEHNLPYHTQ